MFIKSIHFCEEIIVIRLTTKGVGTLEFIVEFDNVDDVVYFISCLSELKNDVFESYVGDFQQQLNTIQEDVKKSTQANQQSIADFLKSLREAGVLPSKSRGRPKKTEDIASPSEPASVESPETIPESDQQESQT